MRETIVRELRVRRFPDLRAERRDQPETAHCSRLPGHSGAAEVAGGGAVPEVGTSAGAAQPRHRDTAVPDELGDVGW